MAMGLLWAAPVKEQASAAETPAFDENNIVLSFGSLSDSHIGYGTNHVNLDRALKQLKTYSSRPIDALYFHGDQTQGHQTGNGGTEADQENQRDEMRRFIGILQDNFDLTKTAAVITNGNHDTCWDGLGPKDFYDVFYEKSNGAVFTFDTENSVGKVAGANGEFIPAEAGDRDVLVNGYHFLTVEIESYRGSNSVGPISADTKVWLKNTLDKITAENPNRYVFVSAHAVVPDSVGGSSTAKWEDGTAKEWGDWGGSVELRDFFLENNYPQVILFSGHTHYNINEERAIMQMMDMTFLQGGSTADACSEKGYENFYGSDRSEGQGMLIEADAGGNIRIRRYDFTHAQQINDAWYLTAPKADKSHLNSFTREARAKAPTFTAEQKAQFSVREISDTSIEVTYPLGTHEMVTSHIISVKDAAGSVIAFKRILTPFRYHPQSKEMPQTYTKTFDDLNITYPYTVEVVAYDTFGTASEPLTVQLIDRTEEFRAAAAAVDAKIVALDAASVSESDGTAISAIREEIGALHYKARAMLEHLGDFEAIESAYYHTYHLTPDAFYAPAASDFYSIASTKKKGTAENSVRTGVTLRWETSAKNNSLGLNTSYALDGLHLVFSDLSFETEARRFGIVISSQARDKWLNGECLLLDFDFDSGSVYCGDLLIGTSDLVNADRIGKSPFELRFSVKDGALSVELMTVRGNATFTVSENQLSSLPHLESLTACYVSFSPWESRMTAQVDLVSVHGSESPCLSPAAEPEPSDPSGGDPVKPEDPSEGDPPATDPSTPETPPASDPADAEQGGGCGSVIFAGAGGLVAALTALFAVALAAGRKKEQ